MVNGDFGSLGEFFGFAELARDAFEEAGQGLDRAVVPLGRVLFAAGKGRSHGGLDCSALQVVLIFVAVWIDEGDGGVAEALFNEFVGLGDGLDGLALFAAHAEFGFDADMLALNFAENVRSAGLAIGLFEGVFRIRLDSRFLEDAREVRIQCVFIGHWI